MVTLLRTLAWLLVPLTVVAELPRPSNLTVSSAQFTHMLTWMPGPGMPPDVHYSVTFTTERETSWFPVATCERVRDPLVCNLTKSLADPDQVYFIKVTALREDQVLGSDVSQRFHPIRDTYLDLPLLTLAPCGGHMCVDFQPPLEDLENIYRSLQYSLRIQSNGVERTQNAKFMRREVLESLSPGREYCVSVRFTDSLVQRTSGYGPPVCGVAPGGHAPGSLLPWVLPATALALLAAAALVAGHLLHIRKPLPRVLTSIHHVDGALVFHRFSVASLLTVEAIAPPAGVQQTPTEEISAEETVESGGGSSGGGYALRDGCNLLFSPSALHPSARVWLRGSSSQECPQPPAGGLTSAAPPGCSDAPAECVSEGETEEEEEERGSSLEVNLLALTFGMQPEDTLVFSSSEDITLYQSAPTWTPGPEEEQEQEQEVESGYIYRPSILDLQVSSPASALSCSLPAASLNR